MFFKRKKLRIPDYSIVNADIHSHLLPGIDDGSPDLETSIELIKGLRSLGFKKLITTPHVMLGMYENTSEIILDKLGIVQEAIITHGIDIELHAAAEYFMDSQFKENLEQKKKLLTLKDNYVLVEFSMASPPLDLKEMLFEMQMQGYQPVIAHPERYIFAAHNKRFFTELKDAGYSFQLNLLSISGYYGVSVQELAKYLMDKNFYSFVGSDLHNQKYLDALSHPSITDPLEKLIASGAIINPAL
jgi:protein-tyrosine phosphatase